jgi:predicted GH43/DUF377 family glycosyl hydrolase
VTPAYGPVESIRPRARIRLNTASMVGRRRDAHAQVFNCSAIPLGGPAADRVLLAFRVDLSRARIHVAELDRDMNPRSPSQRLELGRFPEDAHGQEDPRLWMHGGKFHVSYSGTAKRGPDVVASICYARLDATDDGFRVEEAFAPAYAERQPSEKNWGFFSYERQLFAVYQIHPVHRVLHVHESRAQLAADIEWPSTWQHGLMRGGAPPFRVGDEYWHWFHGFERRPGMRLRYTAGLYTFEARPPFAPKRIVRTPVLVAPDESVPVGNRGPNVVYPGGAYLVDGTWHVSYGLHDTWNEVALLDMAELERLLEPV